MTTVIEGRAQSPGEELANSIVHGAALLASFVALPVLILRATASNDAAHIVGGAIFGTTVIMLYLSSTLYHAWRPGRTKHVFRIMDHSAIYLLIAGTYTPFMIGPLRGPWGWSLLSIIWTLAILGIVAKCTLGCRMPRLSTIVYLAMGWLIVIAMQPFLTHVSPAGIAWLVAGGLCYTAGVVFYVSDQRIRYAHALWHVFVAAGTTFHFIAVLGHAGSRAA